MQNPMVDLDLFLWQQKAYWWANIIDTQWKIERKYSMNLIISLGDRAKET